ncbi:MAG: hypothetical protein AAF623_16570, partial [Planctomycetota bacterium]
LELDCEGSCRYQYKPPWYAFWRKSKGTAAEGAIKISCEGVEPLILEFVCGKMCIDEKRLEIFSKSELVDSIDFLSDRDNAHKTMVDALITQKQEGVFVDIEDAIAASEFIAKEFKRLDWSERTRYSCYYPMGHEKNVLGSNILLNRKRS